MTGDANAESARQAAGPGPSVAVIGLACRFPDADDIAAMLDLVATGRRAFRSLPPRSAGAGAPPGRRSGAARLRLRAALIGQSGPGLVPGASEAEHGAGDPARLLAVETSARALAAAGFAGGAGLPAGRIGLFVGHAPAAAASPQATTATGPRTATALYLDGCAQVTECMAGDHDAPATMATAIRGEFGWRGRCVTVAAGGASSLAAVAAASLELARGDIDIALAGGVDVGLLALGDDAGALIRSGVLATGDMRIYDKNPTGYLPGEGCGMVLLMRTVEAVAAGLPVYAEIAGWGLAADGLAADGLPAENSAPAAGLLAAMRSAYAMAQADPLELALIEGCGAGVAAVEQAELAALGALRAGARRTAVLGSITANIGNTHAAAGAAGLIKTVIAISNGLLPPATGIRAPHPLLAGGAARLRAPGSPERWPGGMFQAGVSAVGPGAAAVHLVLRGQSATTSAGRPARVRPRASARSRNRALAEPQPQAPASREWGSYPAGSHYPFAYLVQAPDRSGLARELSRIAGVAPLLSDAQAQDLAVHLSRAAADAGNSSPGVTMSRVGIVATSQLQLATLASEALRLLPRLGPVLLTAPGIFAAEYPRRATEDAGDRAGGRQGQRAQRAGARGSQRAQRDDGGAAQHAQPPDARARHEPAGTSAGRVTVVLACQPDSADLPQRELSRMLSVLTWLDALGVQCAAAAGHGPGEIAGLVWAGCTTPIDARALIALRSAALADPGETRPGQLSALIGQISEFDFRQPGRRLVSARLGTAIGDRESIVAMLSAELLHGRLTARLRARPAVGKLRPASGSPVAGPAAGQFTTSRDGDRRDGSDGVADRPDRHLLDEQARLDEAIRAATCDADLLLQTGLDWRLARAVRRAGRLPVVSIDGDPADDRQVARAAAALFAIGAVARPEALYAGRPGRPIDIWRDQVTIAGQPPADPAPDLAAPAPAPPDPAAPGPAGLEHESAQPESGRTVPSPAQPATVIPSQADTSQADTSQAEPSQAEPSQAEPSQADTSQAEPSQAEPSRPEPSGPHLPEPSGPQLSEPEIPAGQAGVEARAPRITRPKPATPATGPVIIPGTLPWFRCFADRPQPLPDQIPAGDDAPWQVVTGGCGPLERKVREVFAHDPQAPRTLAVLGGLDDAGTREAALQAARAAVSTGRIVAISPGAALAGFWATLHAEHPQAGVTALRIPLTADGLRAASRFALAVPGEYREIEIGTDGTAAGPAMVPLPLPGGAEFPFGPQDVALISRASGAAGLALAQVLACSGAGVALIGPGRPRPDGGLVAELERLHAAGARVSCEVVDLADHGAVIAAVERIESRLGRVTALFHATETATGCSLAELSYNDVHEDLRLQAAVLDQMAAAVRAAGRTAVRRPARLRHIITAGSIVGRYGLAGQGTLALASGALADQAQRLAAGIPGCRALHIDWPAWAGADLGEPAGLAEACERAGIAPMPVAEGSRLLLKLLATESLPGRLAVHGRVGVPAPRQIASPDGTGGASQAGRFIERILVHYPGLELIAEATLSRATDPYLADYRVDGVPVLPPTMALEAMAQAAAVLAGAPVPRATDVTMAAPVVLPAGTRGSAVVIRICAVRSGDAVTVALRSSNSDFAVDHCLARFADEPEIPRQSDAGLAAIRATRRGPKAWMEGADLYSKLCFQSGRFRRLTAVHPDGSRAASAVAYGPDRLPWFGTDWPAADRSEHALMLGSPGLNDAALQLIQACVPHRQVTLAGCESVSVSGRAPVGLVTLRVTEVERRPDGRSGGAASARRGARALAPADGAVPQQRAGSEAAVAPPRQAAPPAQAGARHAESVWNAEVTDATGQPLVTWRRLRMRATGPLPQPGPWPIPLLGNYLERAAAELGLGPALRVEVSLDNSPGDDRQTRDDRPAGLVLRAEAAVPATVGWRPASLADVEAAAGAPGSGRGWLAMLGGLPPRLAHLGSTLPAPGASQSAVSMAAAQAAAAQAAALASCVGQETVPRGLTAEARHVVGVDWLLLRLGDASVACTVLDVADLGPTAFALMTGVLGASDRPRAVAEPDGTGLPVPVP